MSRVDRTNVLLPVLPESGCTEEVIRYGRVSAPPDVTVIVSLHNYGHYVEETLDSVAGQSLGDFDLIVVDDQSTDDSRVVVERWLRSHSERFAEARLLSNRENQGLARTRNIAFHHARTPNVFVLDADNVLYPRCLESLLGALRQCDASFAYCYLEHFGDVSGLGNTTEWNPATFRRNNTIDAMVLMRKSVWERAGGYSMMEIPGWEDFDLWFKIARLGGWGVHVHEILARYRVHRKSMLKTATNPHVKKLWAHLRATYPEFFGASVVGPHRRTAHPHERVSPPR